MKIIVVKKNNNRSKLMKKIEQIDKKNKNKKNLTYLETIRKWMIKLKLTILYKM
jgi:hypothetical protein